MVIIGLGGLTRDILHDLLQQYSATELLFFTEEEKDVNILYFEKLQLRVTNNQEVVLRYFENEDRRFLILLGNNVMRENLVKKYAALGGVPYYFISKSANLNQEHSTISKVNTVIMHCAMVSAGAVVNEGAIINQYAYLGHDASMGKYSFLGGYSGISKGSIGEFTFIGLKTVILPGRSVGDHSLVGAMTLVNKSIGNRKKAYGTPAQEFPL